MSIRVTVDIVLFAIAKDRLQVLLVERGKAPFLGCWAIPGGFVRESESLEEAALRELAEETGVRDHAVEQLAAFGDPGRDPRGRVVTVAHYALLPSDRVTLCAGTDAAAARFFPVSDLPSLAFDHGRIVSHALARLRARVVDLGFRLLPAHFTLGELQRVHEAILGSALDKRNFRRRIAQLGTLRALRSFRTEGASRPARLYTWQRSR